MILKTLFLIVFIGLNINVSFAQNFWPANIYQLDEKFTPYVILVEKSTHTLYLFQNKKNEPILLKEFKIATGKIKGDKTAQGDHRTPEGIYIIQTFHAEKELLAKYGQEGKMYGSGAFPLNYPNFIDEKLGKTGNGIWIHSTDDDSRINKGLDSRGCVVLANQDLKSLSQFINLKATPVVIVQNLNFLSEKSWKTNRDEIHHTVDAWMKAWQQKDFNGYINSYHEEEFFDKSKGSFKNFKSYKNAVFSRPDKPEIIFTNQSILANDQYALVQLEQDYRSTFINDVGHKILYLKKNKNYEWKIVGELWEKIGSVENNYTPVPHQRFFSLKE